MDQPGGQNTLAVKVTPERAIQDVNGVELADSWWDWINADSWATATRPARPPAAVLRRQTATPASGSRCPGPSARWNRTGDRQHRAAAAQHRQARLTVYAGVQTTG